MPVPGGSPSTSSGDVPESSRPHAASFHARTLNEAPVPILVVDDVGRIVYGNRAMSDITGWTLDQVEGEHILEHIHPDDRDWVIDAFAALMTTADEHIRVGRTLWAPVHLRMLARDGSSLPVDVTGTGQLHDPSIRGTVYEVRPSWSSDLLSRIHRGIASGASEVELLTLVLDLIVAPPLDLEAAILRPAGLGRHEVLVASTDGFGKALAAAPELMSWTSASEPTFEAVAELPGEFGATLAAHGYSDLWHAGVDSRMTSSTYGIVACSPFHHVPASGVLHRLRHAQELASVVLLRSQTDQLLAHGAFHDHLTQLPNRAGLLHQVGDALPGIDAIVLYVDLDGFKPINDRYGHDAGDAVLREVADRLRALCDEGDVVARIGGDEFVVVRSADPESDLDDMVRAETSRAAEAVRGTLQVADAAIPFAASVGGVRSRGELDVQELMSLADAAMFVAKRDGGGRGHVG